MLIGPCSSLIIIQLLNNFLSGGGYILSKKALIKFADIVKRDKTLFSPDGAYEDIRMGKALAHSAIFVDCRDDMRRERFFPFPIRKLTRGLDHQPDWFERFNYYNFTLSGIAGLSDVGISFHYIKPAEMYFLEVLIYHVHPFGLHKNVSETLPKKLKLEEIISASDAKSSALNFYDHKDFHNLTSSELF